MPQHSREKSCHGIDDDHRGQFTTREHVVADRDLEIGPRKRALVETLVASTDQDEMVAGRELMHESLSQGRACRGHEHDESTRSACGEVVDRLDERLGLHHHPRPTSVWVVIRGAMTVMRPVT